MLLILNLCDTFSNEYAGLLQLMGAELDSFFQACCGFDSEDQKNISHYPAFVLKDYLKIRQQEIEIINSDIFMQPFEGWDAEKAKKSLEWWVAFYTKCDGYA